MCTTKRSQIRFEIVIVYPDDLKFTYVSSTKKRDISSYNILCIKDYIHRVVQYFVFISMTTLDVSILFYLPSTLQFIPCTLFSNKVRIASNKVK